MNRQPPDFSPFAAQYARSRPTYPADLYAWLSSTAPCHDLAWDCATGNGQAAVGLARHFTQVVASDMSEPQLVHAQHLPNIFYVAGSAEAVPLREASVDVVAAAASAHWFDLAAFAAEVRRVTKPGGVVAAWTYHVAHMEGPHSEVVVDFYHDKVADHFGDGARLVDARYETLDLPGERIDVPEFHVAAEWNPDQLLDFVRWWSGVRHFIETEGHDPTIELESALKRAWPDAGTPVSLRWPIYARAARL